MNNVITRLNLIEELMDDGLSDKLIESIVDAEDDKLEFVVTCNDEKSLHDTIKKMSSVEEDNE